MFLFAQSVQNIRGRVRDGASDVPLPYVYVVINTNPTIGTTTDSIGNFVLPHVPVGRYDIEASYLGYESTIIKEILVTSGKEVVLEIPLKEKLFELNEVVVKPTINKSQPMNKMASASARMLSVDEASRYAGGFDDPARLASSFAGVAGNMGNNGIVVRGNAPKFLQWRFEEIEIPNPNHFADVTGFGGGGLTALSSQVLGNSDFFTGAFPAEYGNALSGVFDIKMRNGNNNEVENTVQIGLIGMDAASEGPLKKGSRSSYLFNYRYSTMALLEPLLPEDAGGVRYQDLSFKFNFPTKKAGTFSLWGIGLIDRSGTTAETDPDKWEFMQDKEDQDVKQYMGAAGLAHRIQLNNTAFMKTTLAATVSGLDMHTERMNNAMQLQPQNVINKTDWNFILHSYINKKFGARHTNKTGITVTGLMYNMLLKEVPKTGSPMQTFADENGFSTLLAAYSNSSINISDKWTVNAGLYGQFFTLNNQYTIEPRLGLKYAFAHNQSLSLAYGLHSRLEMLNYYFSRSIEGKEINKDLDFTRSQHLVLSYDMNIGNDFHLRVEPYVQQLFNVPVIADSSYSFINLQKDWFIQDKLENTGKGFNYGIDVTFEKFMSQGYYFMLTGSLFNSRYKGGDAIWRDTRYNRNFLFNFLTGKEWMVGNKKQNIFSANIRLSYQGGDHYSPVNDEESLNKQDVVYDEIHAFEKQLSPAFLGHFTVSYKINRKKVAHEFAIKVINATNYKEFYGHRYNFKKHTIEEEREALMIPNVSYKIEF